MVVVGRRIARRRRVAKSSIRRPYVGTRFSQRLYRTVLYAFWDNTMHLRAHTLSCPSLETARRPSGEHKIYFRLQYMSQSTTVQPCAPGAPLPTVARHVHPCPP